ncbi:MAG: CRISPR-associated endonuclease Cas9 [Candidatus Hepatoplasma scabrum]|nr:MAG: CRISPR-associated endonuclease Cas9 [Candidatus Hepatoplasma sp.]
MNKEQNKKFLALDIGVTSLGWAISEYNKNTKKIDILDFGVRLWDSPEDSKSLDTKSSERRIFRSGRRLNSRKKTRIKDLKNLFYSNNFLSAKDYSNHSEKIKLNGKNYLKNNIFDPLILRKKGLTEKLTNLELLIALINIAKRRGYSNKFIIPDLEEKNNDARESIKKSDELIAKYKYPILAITESNLFNFNSPEKFIYRSKKLNLKKFEKYIYEDKSKTKIIETNVNNLILKYDLKFDKNTNLKQKVKTLQDKINEFYTNHQILFNRKDYEIEVDAIIDKQIEYNSKLKNLEEDIKKIIFRQRDFEDGPGPNDQKIKEFWKNSLKKDSKQFYYKPFIENVGYCQFFPNKKRVSCFSIENDISFILNESSKIFSKLKKEKNIDNENIKILTKEIFNNYFTNFKFDKKIINDIFEKNKLQLPPILKGISFANSGLFLHNFAKKKENKEFILKNLNINLNFLNSIKESKINKIAEILFKYKTPQKLKNKLIEIDNFFNDDKKGYEWIKNNNDWIKRGNKTLSTSSEFILSALKNQLETGELISEYQYRLNAKKDQEKINKLNLNAKEFEPIRDKDMQKNSVVFRSINQIRLVVRDLFKKYNNFDNVIIEVAKDLYAEKKIRKNIRNNQDKNQKRREEAAIELKKNNLDPSNKNINKYLIWKEQQIDQQGKKEQYAIDIYDINLKEKIYLKEFILDINNNYQIDHIAPYSLVNDDSKNNKIVTSTKNNALKNNKTPLDYFKSQNLSTKIISNWKNKIEKSFDKNQIKQSYLFLDTINRSTEMGFETRDINDTRYITKYISDYFKLEFTKISKKKNILTPKILQIQGGITSYFRRMWLNPTNSLIGSLWGDDKKLRDISPFHHAVDAIILSNMISKEHIEIYQLSIRIIRYYNYLVNQFYKNKLDKFNVKEELFKQKKAIDQVMTNFNIVNFTRADLLKEKIDDIFSYIINEIDQRIKNNQKLEKIDFKADKFIFNLISPLIENLPQKINNLIPVKLKWKEEESIKEILNINTNELKKEKIKNKVPGFLNTIEASEWAKLNNKKIEQYPYVSYKIDKRVRGQILAEQNPSGKKEALDPKTKQLKSSFIKDKAGNYWDISKYIGYQYDDKNKLIPIYRNKMIEYAKNKQKINLVLFRNAQFKLPDSEIVYVYRGLGGLGKVILAGNANLKQQSDSKYEKIIGNWPRIGVAKAQELKLVNITRLGKLQE